MTERFSLFPPCNRLWWMAALVFLLIVGNHANLYSQNLELINRLKVELQDLQGEARFKTLNAIGWEYRFSNPDSTIWYASKAYKLGVDLKLKKELGRSLNYIGIANNYKGERIKAYDYFDQALSVANQQMDSAQIAHANNNIGRLFFEQGVLSKSYKYYITALDIFNATHDLSGIAYTYQSLANLYKAQNDFEKSDDNLKKAYQIRKRLGNKRDIMAAAMYLGTLYQAENKIAESSNYFMMADSLGMEIHDEINIADVKIRLAENYLKEGDLVQAQTVGNAGYEVISRMDNQRLLPNANLLMGQIALAKKDLANAKKYFERSLRVSTEINDATGQMNAYYQLAAVAGRQGQKQLEVDMLNHYLVLNDSIKDLEVARQVERFQFQIEIENKDKENDLLKIDQARKDAVIAKQRIQNIGLLVITLLVSIISFVIWRYGRKNKIINEQLALTNEEITRQREEIALSNDQLYKHNQQLSELNHEKDTLMSIVAHDLRSPVNRILGLAHLMELTGGLPETQREYLGMIKKATKSGSDLITDLLDVNSLAERDIPLRISKVNLNELIIERIGLVASEAEIKKIEMESACNLSGEFYSEGNYIARIMDNLLSNAIKFSGSPSRITIHGVVENGWAVISIRDQGPGFTDEDKQFLFQRFKKLTARPTGGESSNGLGLAIVKILVDRLLGEIKLNSKIGAGAEFIIRIPSANPPPL